ncbi:hypothetical protein [Streptomyces sp. NPDC007355]
MSSRRTRVTSLAPTPPPSIEAAPTPPDRPSIEAAPADGRAAP